MRPTLYITALILFAASTLQARDVPPAKGYVSDYAGMLTPSEIQTLDQKLRDYDNKTSTQIVVLIIKSLEGEAIESFGIKVFDKWKPGQKGKDNGVIFIISLDEHKTRIEVGYGLEGTLTDLLCSVILSDVVKPEFRKGNYFEGINQATDKIIAAIKGEYTVVPVSPEPIPFPILHFAFIIFVILVVWLTDVRSSPVKSLSRERWTTITFDGGGGGGGGFSGGGGGGGGGGASGGW